MSLESEFPNVGISTPGDELPEDRTPVSQIDPTEERAQKIALGRVCVRRFKRWLDNGKGMAFTFAMPDDVGAAMIRRYETALASRNFSIEHSDGILRITAIKA